MSLEPGDADSSQSRGGESQGSQPFAPASRVTFDRRELNRIFNLYGRMVAAGEWRDYAIDFLRDRAVFSAPGARWPRVPGPAGASTPPSRRTNCASSAIGPTRGIIWI